MTEGLILRTKAGNVVQNPLVGAVNKAMADMVRTRVSATSTSDADDPFAQFG